MSTAHFWTVAHTQQIHERQLALYRELARTERSDGMRLALECGIGHEREYVRYWKRLAG